LDDQRLGLLGDLGGGDDAGELDLGDAIEAVAELPQRQQDPDERRQRQRRDAEEPCEQPELDTEPNAATALQTRASPPADRAPSRKPRSQRNRRAIPPRDGPGGIVAPGCLSIGYGCQGRVATDLASGMSPCAFVICSSPSRFSSLGCRWRAPR